MLWPWPSTFSNVSHKFHLSEQSTYPKIDNPAPHFIGGRLKVHNQMFSYIIIIIFQNMHQHAT